MMEGEGASVLQCPCGRAVLCQVRQLGERLGALAFYDNATSSTSLRCEKSRLSQDSLAHRS
jgi:hypothetical protein